MKVGIWIRVSTDEQARGESPKRHEARARMYAEIKEWDVVELYDLSGVSGKSILFHPETQRMMNDITEGKIQGIIFSKLARLARNVKELIEISEHFQEHDAHLISLEENIDTSSPAGRLLFTMIGALAQWEREEIASRVAASVPIRAKLGQCTGGIGPYGYKWVDKKLIIDEDAAVNVKAAYEIFLKEHNLSRTIRVLNQKGYRSRYGKFTRTGIKRLLTDTAYKGIKRANYSKKRDKGQAWSLKPKSDWIYFRIDPIISEEVWKETNMIIKKNAEPFPSTPPPVGKYVFSGIVYCNNCKSKMYVMKYKYMKTPRYRCQTCKKKMNEDYLFGKIKEGLKQIIIKPYEIRKMIKDNRNGVENKEKQLEVFKKELTNIQFKINKLLELYNENMIDKETFSSRFTVLRERKEQIDNEIPGIQGTIDYMKSANVNSDYLINKAKSLYSSWDKMLYKEKAEIIKQLIQKITVFDNKIIIDYYYLNDLMVVCKDDHNHMDSMPVQA